MNKYKLAVAILTLAMITLMSALIAITYFMIGTYAITLWIGIGVGTYLGWKLNDDWKI